MRIFVRQYIKPIGGYTHLMNADEYNGIGTKDWDPVK